MGSTSLSIGSGYVNTFEFSLGVSQMSTKCKGIGQVLFESRSSNPLKHGKGIKEVIERFLVSHVRAA
jgi:hypothetical protein